MFIRRYFKKVQKRNIQEYKYFNNIEICSGPYLPIVLVKFTSHDKLTTQRYYFFFYRKAFRCTTFFRNSFPSFLYETYFKVA